MAVYTHLTEQDIREYLQHYALGELRAAVGIAEGIENSNYLLVLNDATGQEKQKAILTLFEKRVQAEDLPYYLGVMDHLYQNGFICPQPIRGHDGALFYACKGRPAAVVSFLEGAGARGIQNAHLPLLGTAQAELHLAGKDFPMKRENTLSLAGWKELLDKIGTRADEVSPGLFALMQDELVYLQAHWPTNLPRGVIHADLFPDNVFFFRDKHGIRLSGVIDFYFACDDFWAYELAICLNAWCFQQHHEFNITRAQLMLHAYHKVRQLTEDELVNLPILCRGAALRFLLTRTHDWLFRVEGALVNPKDPMEYVKKLRFHQGVNNHREYGI